MVPHSWIRQPVEDKAGKGKAHGVGMPKGAFGNGTCVWCSQDVSDEKSEGFFPPVNKLPSN